MAYIGQDSANEDAVDDAIAIAEAARYRSALEADMANLSSEDLEAAGVIVDRELAKEPHLHEFAFDIEMAATVRVRADSLEAAKKMLYEHIVEVDPTRDDPAPNMRVTEYSILPSSDSLFEYDGDESTELDFCSKCGAFAADGEGYDGLCGNCADKADR